MKSDYVRMIEALKHGDRLTEEWERLARIVDGAEPKKTSGAGDISSEPANTGLMNNISREEFNAKLETIEARMDARIESVHSKIDSFLSTQAAVQVEREKAQAERDRRLEMLAERATRAAEGAEEAAKQAATVKANYWAAVGVQLLAVVAILVGAYYANQANVFGAMQTTMGAFTLGKDSPQSPSAQQPSDKTLSK